MEKKYTVESLRERIRELEIRQQEEGLVLKGRMHETVEMFRPVNILKSIVGDITSADGLGEELANSSAGFITGLITKNLVVGKSKSPFVKLIGIALQFGMTALITKNYGAIKNLLSQLVTSFVDKFSDQGEPEIQTVDGETGNQSDQTNSPTNPV